MESMWPQFLGQIHQKQQVSGVIFRIKTKWHRINKIDPISGLVSSICKRLQIPHFTALWQPIDPDVERNSSFTRNLYPHPKLFATALYQIVRSFHWNKVAVVYDSDEALMRLQQIFPLTYDKNFAGRILMEAFKMYRLTDDDDSHLFILKTLKSRFNINHIVLDCSLENIKKFVNLTNRVITTKDSVYQVCIGTGRFFHICMSTPFNTIDFPFVAIFHCKQWCSSDNQFHFVH